MITEELINKLHNTDRVIVKDHTGEVYRGYIRLLKSDPAFSLIRDSLVDKLEMHVELFRREYVGRYNHARVVEAVDRAMAGKISYMDMEEHIYFLIKIGA